MLIVDLEYGLWGHYWLSLCSFGMLLAVFYDLLGGIWFLVSAGALWVTAVLKCVKITLFVYSKIAHFIL